MVEILLDTKFWNKVFKILKPTTVLAVKKNKGAKQLQFIPSSGAGNLDNSNNKPGFLYKYVQKNRGNGYKFRTLAGLKVFLWQHELTQARVEEIEKAILQVAVAECLLPESVLYDGKPVIKTRKMPDRSTVGFGFIYFVRNDEIYKIGITDNLLRRIKQLKPDEILNSVRCSNYQEIEKKMHAHFKKRRIPQTEYFRLDASEVEEAHALMTEMANF